MLIKYTKNQNNTSFESQVMKKIEIKKLPDKSYNKKDVKSQSITTAFSLPRITACTASQY